jgi:Zn-dependent protease with chaperone function
MTRALALAIAAALLSAAAGGPIPSAAQTAPAPPSAPAPTPAPPGPLPTPSAQLSGDDRTEAELGRRYAIQLESQLPLVKDNALQERARTLGLAVGSRTERPNMPWSFRVVEASFPNAVALPGGYVFVTSAMVKLLRTDHEMAALFAHESAHVALRHHRRMQEESTRANLWLIAAALLTRDPRVAAAGQYVAGGILSAFSRTLEREADLAAVGYLLRTSKWHPAGVLTLLERIAYEDLLSARIDPGAFRTHPTWAERLDAVERELSRFAIPFARRVTAGYLILHVREEAVGATKVGIILLNDQPVMRIAGGLPRAEEVAARLDRALNNDPSPFEVRALQVWDEWSVRIQEDRVLVLVEEDARVLGRPLRDLATEYAQRIRQAITEDQRRRLYGRN